MSKSLRIIDNKIKYSYSQGILLTNIELEELQTIKQELELKEQLKQQRDSLAVNNNELAIKVCNLEKENKELKEDVKTVMADYQDVAKIMFELDKVLEILKDKIRFEFFEPKDEQEMKECLKANEEPYLIRMGEEWFTIDDKNKFELLKKVLS